MVLHMRKIISVSIALIMMMSAAPVFADEEQTEVNQPAAAPAAAETEQESTDVAPSSSESGSQQDRQAVKPAAAGEEEWVEITLYDSDGNRLENRERVQLEKNVTFEELLREFAREKSYRIDWENCSFEINNEMEDNLDIKSFRPEAEDEIVIREQAEMDQANLDTQAAAEEEASAPQEEVLGTVAPDTLENAYKSTSAKIKSVAASAGWEFSSEWTVMGLSRSDNLSDAEAKLYCDRIAAYVESRNSDRMSDRFSSDNARLILALTSLGYDPTDVNGKNLLKPLADMDFVNRQGLSGPVWALIAFDSHDYEIPEAEAGKTQTSRQGLIDTLLARQLADKGWAFSGTKSDVDMTCMVLQALTPYYNDDHPAVKTAVDEALGWLSSVQNRDGSFTDSSESHSQVIVALCGLGIDPEKDSRFVKGNSKSAIDALMKFYATGGGFRHVTSDRKQNLLASQQGYYAITAFYRFRQGSSSLYDMSDMELVKFTGTAKPGDVPAEKPVETAGKAMGKTRGLGFLGLGDEAADSSLIKENFGSGQNGDALSEQEAYNEYVKSQRMAKTLPWIYMAAAALAVLGILLILRNRKPE